MRGLHHIGLTVSDVEASARWYESVLGLERVGSYESPDGARKKIFLSGPAIGVRLGLVEHRGGVGRSFDETVVGLDHVAFTVDEAALDDWERRLEALGVTLSPRAPANTVPGAFVVVFRDPDNIQLELFSVPAIAGEQGDRYTTRP